MLLCVTGLCEGRGKIPHSWWATSDQTGSEENHITSQAYKSAPTDCSFPAYSDTFLSGAAWEFAFERYINTVRQAPFETETPASYQNVIADVLQLGLDLLPVLFAHLLLLLIPLCFLLNAGDDAPGGAAGAHHVLVGDREQISLLVGEFVPLFRDGLHGGGHVVIALGLLGKFGLLYQLTFIHGRSLGQERARGERESKCQASGPRKCTCDPFPIIRKDETCTCKRPPRYWTRALRGLSPLLIFLPINFPNSPEEQVCSQQSLPPFLEVKKWKFREGKWRARQRCSETADSSLPVPASLIGLPVTRGLLQN